jgi:CheY-like chemotaxis protein
MSYIPHALIIDDEAFNLEVLGRILAAQGVTVTKVQDVKMLQSAVTAAQQIDIVFLDLEMPHMNGYEVFELLRSQLSGAVPIVACTVHANEVSTARDLGFHSFISKPLDQTRFPKQLQSILRGEPVWDFS